MEGVEYSANIGMISTAETEVIGKLTSVDPGSPAKRMKTFLPQNMVTISDPVISRFITKIQIHLNHSAEVIVGNQQSISLLNSKIGDVPEYHTQIWCTMGYIMKKLVSHGELLDNLDLDSLMKEYREAHILTVNIKTSVDDAIAQTTSTVYKVGSISATFTQLLPKGSGGRIDSMHNALNMGDQNIGMLQLNLTVLCNVVETLEHKMNYLSQHETDQLIKDSSTIPPRDDFDVQLSELTAE